MTARGVTNSATAPAISERMTNIADRFPLRNTSTMRLAGAKTCHLYPGGKEVRERKDIVGPSGIGRSPTSPSTNRTHVVCQRLGADSPVDRTRATKLKIGIMSPYSYSFLMAGVGFGTPSFANMSSYCRRRYSLGGPPKR